METKQCTQCGISFEITNQDKEFYDKISPIFGGKKYQIPSPSLCPDCREQRRLARRNERNLYKRKCDLSGKDMISIYNPNNNYKVYDQKIRRSDKRDPMQYGKEFDENISFFSQFTSLLQEVPRISLNGHISNENSEYVNYVVQSKNCYMCFGGGYNESILYSTIPMYSKHCIDAHFCLECEECYETSCCKKCFKVQYGYNCESCRDCYFIENCEGCHNCFGCSGLINQNYYIFNKKVSSEEYNSFIQNFISSSKEKENIMNQVSKELLNFPKKNLNISFSENCTGNNIAHSSNCIHCYTTENIKNAKRGNTLLSGEDIYDADFSGIKISQIYEIMTCSMQIHNCKFSLVLRENCSNLYYCSDCNTCSDCFGCIGLKQKQYCILNKQYTKEEYEQLIPKIIEKMISDKERGEFFPISISPFGYNETVAYEYFPLSREEALTKGYKRSDYEAPFPQVEKILKSNEVPDIKEVSDEILQQAIECEITKKLFRIIKPELDFYRKHSIPLPKKHPNQRHLERMQKTNPMKLRERICAKCGTKIKTTYSPERSEIVYCETCYNKEIYG